MVVGRHVVAAGAAIIGLLFAFFVLGLLILVTDPRSVLGNPATHRSDRARLRGGRLERCVDLGKQIAVVGTLLLLNGRRQDGRTVGSIRGATIPYWVPSGALRILAAPAINV